MNKTKSPDMMKSRLNLDETPRKIAQRPISPADAQRLYPAPGNCRAYLQQPCDYRIVAARPDLKCLVYPATAGESYYWTGFGFVLLNGAHPVPFDFDRVEQRFAMGALPLLSQVVTQSGFRFALDSFTRHDEIGRGLIHLRMTVWRTGDSPDAVELGWLATRDRSGRFSSHGNTDYLPFESWAPAWERQLPLTAGPGCLHDGDFLFCAYRHSPGIAVVPDRDPGSVRLRFRVTPGRSEPETIEMVVPYENLSNQVDNKDGKLNFCPERAFRVAERDALLAISFAAEWQRRQRQWASDLARATGIEVPDPVVQDTYRTLTLNNLQFLGSSAGTTALRPGQGGYNDFAMVYAWEASHYLTIMARQGYHAEVRRVLDYLLTTQSGKGPEGDISDAEGCFRPHIHWMNETGAVLAIFAEYAFASGDVERLRNDAAALIKAARWIQRQRALTREALPDGSRALHYGLLPKGRPHDWRIRGHFIFSDAYTWRGLDALARASRLAGLADAGWLQREADEYRACILAAVRGSLKPHPLDPALKWVPSEIYEDPIEAIKTTIFCGPNALLGSGILDSGDELVPIVESCLRAANCMNDHFAFRMRHMEEENLRKRQLELAGGCVDLYYVTFAESPWHRFWLERGEREKAESSFNMTMAYSVSRDLHLAQERYCPQLPWLLPWQPNASGNGRILDMILRNLCFADGDTCHLLYGVPDAWFEARSPIGVDGLWIGGSRCVFRLEPGGGGAGWDLVHSCAGDWVPRRLLIALPDGSTGGRTIKEVVTQGKAAGRCRI